MSDTGLKRYCYRCGAELPENADFCHKCGYRMESSVRTEQTDVLDCRQTKYAIYLSEEQAARGGSVNYYFDEAKAYVPVKIESGIVSGTEKIIRCNYINMSGNAVQDIRHIKIVVGNNGPDTANPHQYRTKRTAPSVSSSRKQRSSSKIIFGAVAGILILLGITFVFKPSGLQQSAINVEQSASANTSETKAQAPKPQDSHPTAVEMPISEVIPHYEDRFYLKNLDPSLHRDAIVMYTGIAAFRKSINLPTGISEDEAELLVNVMQYDCPELFQVDYSGQYMVTTTNGRVSSISLNYSMDKGEYDKCLQECQKVIHTLVSSTKNLGSETKEKHVYDYLADKVTYDIFKPNCGNAYGALVKGYAKCDGISLAMKWIMEECGIPTIVLTGQEKGDPYGHAWNCLFFNGHYYDLDLTNDLKSPDRMMKLYGAYNVPRTWLTRTYPLSDFITKYYNIPTITSMDYSYHAKHDTLIMTGENIRDRFYDALDNAEWNGEGVIQFEEDTGYLRFMNDYEYYMDSWFEENGYGGSFSLSTLREFRTVGFEVEID